ncbi:hypothetical protein Mmc1_2578 [Magnetococcus marinus MC-1]|uniref:Uncharacterized protein n=2 Tax=Magnetococcus TaxID=162171 RepID=A0LAT4_MAGMM|nr:hypothetical protein Mmc1_2578 [Magnetococcus marinus MC-1]
MTIQQGNALMNVAARHIREGMIQAISTQIETNDPAISRTTFERLQKSGFDADEAKRLMASVLAHEMFMINQHNQPYDSNRHAALMGQLPRLPG